MNTNTNNVLTAIAILNNYNRFTVDNGNRRFMCSGIGFSKSAPDFVEFQKQAATLEYSDGAIIDATATPDCLTLKSASGTEYRITAAHDSTLDKSAGRADSLQALIDWDRSGATGDMVRLVLDLGQHRQLTAAQDFKLKSWVNRNFGGWPVKHQIPRTVYFQQDSDGTITAGIYSIEEEKPITSGFWWSNEALDMVLDMIAAAAAA